MCLLKQFGMNIEDWLKIYFCKNVNLPSTILDSDTNKEGHYNLSSLVARTSFTTTRLTTQCGEFRASNFKDCSFNHEIEFNILVNILQLSCLRQ